MRVSSARASQVVVKEDKVVFGMVLVWYVMSPTSIHTPTHTVRTCTPKGRLAHALMRAHTPKPPPLVGSWDPWILILDGSGRLNQSSVRPAPCYRTRHCAWRLSTAEHEDKQVRISAVGYVRVDSMAKARAKARAKVSKREIKKKRTAAVLCFCVVCVVGARMRHLRWPCRQTYGRTDRR